MMMVVVNNVLIDTSAWIDFFRNSNGRVGDLVTDLIRLDRACITGPILAELLHGVRGKEEVSQLNLLFATISCLAIEHDDWIVTGNTLHKLQRKGLSVPLTDVLIATVAIKNSLAVLTLDKHFHHLSVECLNIS